MFGRRDFLISGAAALVFLPAAACAQSSPAPKPFTPTRFSVQVRGSGPDVILIPGLTSGRDVWAQAVAGVPGYRYHLVQIGGFAREPVRGNTAGPVAGPVAAEIARYIAARGLKSPAVVGHSMGGVVAMMLAARHPASVGKLMVVDILPDPSVGYGASSAALRPFADSLLGALSGTPEGRRTMGSLMAQFGGAEAAEGSDPDVVARATHELATTDLTPELPRITAPVSILYVADPSGTRDAAQTDRLYAAAYAGARRKRLTRIPDSGHMIMYDQPARFARELKAFLAS